MSRCKYKNEKERKLFYRANYLLSRYNSADRDRFGEEGNLNAKFIVENIFNKPCAHCGKTGWDVIGCNRLDNSKPHTIDNVEPCCKSCNSRLNATKNVNTIKNVYQYDYEGNLIKIWNSIKECGYNGFEMAKIYKSCKDTTKMHKGYRWSFVPL